MADGVQVSLLPKLLPLASMLLVFSIAYLKLEPFQHSVRVAKYAEKCLRMFDNTDIRPHFTQTTDYQSLKSLADSTVRKDLPSNVWIHRIFFKYGQDRWITIVSTVISLIVLIVGSLHSIMVPFLGQLFGENQIIWTWVALVFLIVSATIIGIMNEMIVYNMKKLMDENVHNLSEIAKGIKARDIDIKDAAS